MSNVMYNLLVIRGPEDAINMYKIDATDFFVTCEYKGSEFYASNLKIRYEAAGIFAVSFESPWSPPFEAVEKMSNDFNNLVFELTYEEEQVRYYEGFYLELSDTELIKYCGTAKFYKGECLSYEGGYNWGIVLDGLEKTGARVTEPRGFDISDLKLEMSLGVHKALFPSKGLLCTSSDLAQELGLNL